MINKWSAEDSRFLVTVPQLPGCRTDGRTYEEAVINASIIISEWIDTAKKQEGLYLVSQNKTTELTGRRGAGIAGKINRKNHRNCFSRFPRRLIFSLP